MELFGSFARGDFTPASDVDLVIIVSRSDAHFLVRPDAFRHAFATIPFDVNLLVYTRAEADRLEAEPTGFLCRALHDALPLLAA